MVPLGIVVSTVGSRSLAVLKASIVEYGEGVPIFVHYGDRGNFGDDYNIAIARAFGFYGCREVIVANDDVVLDPDTVPTLLEDVARIRVRNPRVGFVAARSNFVRSVQNINSNPGSTVVMAPAISPIFAWLSREAFDTAKFPPINWYGDDVMCADLVRAGFVHYVSRAYVHHAGSLTIGRDAAQLTADAMPWLQANRPQYVREWFR